MMKLRGVVRRASPPPNPPGYARDESIVISKEIN
jgi:hypothetical protein